MCRVDDLDETADVYKIDRRLAIKEHRCGECRRTILAGEYYEHHSIIGCGSASWHKVCSHCAVLREWLRRDCGGAVTGEVIEDIEEHAEEYRREDLKELALDARGQWAWDEGTRRDGFRGKPIPELPPPVSLPPESP